MRCLSAANTTYTHTHTHGCACVCVCARLSARGVCVCLCVSSVCASLYASGMCVPDSQSLTSKESAPKRPITMYLEDKEKSGQREMEMKKG